MSLVPDITHLVDDPFTLPLCPLCDQPIPAWAEGRLVIAHGVKFLICDEHDDELEDANDC